jgi:hypothetical protein
MIDGVCREVGFDKNSASQVALAEVQDRTGSDCGWRSEPQLVRSLSLSLPTTLLPYTTFFTHRRWETDSLIRRDSSVGLTDGIVH